MQVMSVETIASKFALGGDFISYEPITTGIINRTYLLTCGTSSVANRYILQNLNQDVFRNPKAVMENIRLVTNHLAAQGQENALTLIPTLQGDAWLSEASGEIWRCFPFIENSRTFGKAPDPETAFRAGQAFGEFQASLSSLDPNILQPTIPNFHHTPTYFKKFSRTLETDPLHRSNKAQKEIQTVFEYEYLKTRLADATLPLRITHNDTKISNVLFPIDKTRAATVIDLDTVMPGLVHYDYGDLIRSAAANAPEDEQDLSKIYLRAEIKDALSEGYLSVAKKFLTPAEEALLPISTKVITYELALRFLTDYLGGDLYFRCDYDGHNLTRARNQLALLRSMEER